MSLKYTLKYNNNLALPKAITFCIIIALFCPITSISQTLTLADIPLNWDNYTKVNYDTSTLHNYTAYTSTSFYGNAKTVFINGKKYYKVRVKVAFNPSSSCVNKQYLQQVNSVEKQRLLNHEKTHYVISLICYKEMIDSIAKIQQIKENEIKACIQPIYDKYSNESNALNKAYDLVTNHSLNNEQQQQTEQSLLQRLSTLYKGQPLFTEKEINILVTHSMQKKGDPLHYQYPEILSLLYEETFDDNHNHWKLYTDSTTNKQNTKVLWDSGVCTIENLKKDNDNAYVTSLLNIDYTKDYEIEFAFKINHYKKKQSPTVLVGWGADSTKDNGGTQLAFSYFGDFEISNCVGGDHKACTHKQGFAEHYFNKETNVISFRKIGDTCYLFVNGKFEKSIPANNFIGKQMFIGAFPSCSVSYDYIKVYDL